jgi:PEP-CTERM motif
MRAFSLIMLTAALLATASVPVSAAQIAEDFTISVSGDSDQHFLSTPFDLFDPSLGTLLSAGEFVTGPLTWDFGDANGTPLFLSLRKTDAFQSFTSGANGSQVINVSLNGAAGFQAPQFLGPGTTQESLFASGSGSLSGDLTGQVVYTYTPALVPEPSTWALMLLGFAGLGYAAVRRKDAHRSVPA